MLDRISRTACLVTIALTLLAYTSACGATVTSVTTNDDGFHVFAPGQPFSFALTYSGDGVTGYQWVDWNGNDVGPAISVSGHRFTVNSPTGVQIKPGYYGLRLLPAGTVIDPGHRRELGFAALTKSAASTPDSLRFGMNHSVTNDPYLRFAGTKIAWGQPWWTWDAATSPAGTLNAAGWQADHQKILDSGKTDLPIVAQPPWTTTPPNLTAIGAMAGAFFKATPDIPAWEWGIEESHNGWDRKTAEDYYRTLAPKYEVLRREADENGAARTKLVHQIEGVWESDPTRMEAVRTFFQSDALKYVDVLSLHPYAWPDFRSPDLWLDAYLKEVNRCKAASTKSDLPIWFTETGCVIDSAGLGPNKMQDGGSPVTGLSRHDAADFLVKSHIIAFADGVSRIYWYSYIDWDASPSNAESHFGLRDFWGYPGPQYAAYATLADTVGAKRFVRVSNLPKNVHTYKFGDSGSACYVVWAFPAPDAPVNVPLSSIAPDEVVTGVTDTVGTPMALGQGDSVPIDGSPVYVTTTAGRPQRRPKR